MAPPADLENPLKVLFLLFFSRQKSLPLTASNFSLAFTPKPEAPKKAMLAHDNMREWPGRA